MSKQVLAVKFVEGTEDELEILLVPFGGLFTGKSVEGCDLDGEHFTKNTDLCLEFFPESRPLLYDHGHDPDVDAAIVGRIDSKSSKQDDKGHWFRAQLDKSSQYFEAIRTLVAEGKLFASSGALGHLVQVAKSGEILRWPLIEGSLTPTPSNLLASVAFADASKHYKSAGLNDNAELEAHVKALMESIDTAGGALVPEQTLTEAVEKKATPASDDDDDAEDEDKPKAKPTATPKPKTRASLEKALRDALALIEESKAAAEPEQVDKYKNVVAVQEKGNLVLLVPEADAKIATDLPAAVKDGEFILSSGRYYGAAPEGSVEDWLYDLRRLLNKSSMLNGPFECAGYIDIIATFGVNGPGHALVSLCSYDMDDEIKWFDVTFDVDDDGEPVITGATPYASVYMPIDQLPPTTLGLESDDDDMNKSMLPFKMHGDFVILAAKSFGHRTKGFAQERSKEGRILSSANRERISKFLEQWKAVGEDLQALYDNTEPKAKTDKSVLLRELEFIELELQAHQLLEEGVTVA